ncbi:MAG: hypothetical protein LH618_11515 [Saprospiraceae bacterium]|nr:hypothetical protein [Saprospiraceae bacterium]
MAEHGNSNKNSKPHHLYEIRDSEDDEIFKYGISHYPIGEDGYSNRMRIQVDFLNLGVKWLRFFARILLLDIPGKRKQNALNVRILENIGSSMVKNPRGNKDD